MRLFGLLVASLALADPTTSKATSPTTDDAALLAASALYLERHCPPLHMDARKEQALLSGVPHDVDTKWAIATRAQRIIRVMEHEGDPEGHCLELYHQIGPAGLNMLLSY